MRTVSQNDVIESHSSKQVFHPPILEHLEPGDGYDDDICKDERNPRDDGDWRPVAKCQRTTFSSKLRTGVTDV